jgi:hypothetical protein
MVTCPQEALEDGVCLGKTESGSLGFKIQKLSSCWHSSVQLDLREGPHINSAPTRLMMKAGCQLAIRNVIFMVQMFLVDLTGHTSSGGMFCLWKPNYQKAAW